MRNAEFSEILEECLETVLQGRLTVNECLSLYPRFARELEPLLTTALEVDDAFQSETPPWHVQEGVRLRVLAAYKSRERSRRLVSGVDLGHSGHWSARHWGALASGIAAVFGAVALVSLVILSAGQDEGGPDGSATPFVIELQGRAERARRAYVEDGLIDAESLTAISRGARDFLASNPNGDSIIAGLDPDQVAQLQAAIADAGEYLESLPPDELVGSGQGSTVGDVQKDVDDIATMIAGVAAAPTPASEEAADAPSPTDAASPTSAPSTQPTPAPTPTAPLPATPVPSPPPGSTN
jgi:hypothetical protein